MDHQSYQPEIMANMQRKIAAWLEEQSSVSKDVSLENAAQLLHELAEQQMELAERYEALRREHLELVQANKFLRGEIESYRQEEEALVTQARVLESMAEGVTITDNRGNIIYTNPAFDAMFGYGSGELLGRHSNMLNYYPPEVNLQMVKEILNQVNNTGAWFGEFHNRKKDGSPFFTSARISALEVGGKKLFISVQEDITERKRDEEMLRRQAELLALAHDAIVVRDLVGRVSYWNRGAEELYGWPRHEAMGKEIHRLLATKFPESLLAIESRVIEQGFWDGELVHTTRDGRRLIVESRWSLKRDEEGRPLAILEINRDITPRRLAEEALRKSEWRFRILVEANIIGMAVSDEEKIIEANDAFLQMLGYTREEMQTGEIGWVELTPTEFLPQDALALYELKTTGAYKPLEKAYLRKDGSQVSVVVGGALLEEDPLTWVSFIVDISERKQLEAALRQSEARFRAIFSNASIGIATTDLEGRLQQFNAPVIKGLGYTPTELQGKSFMAITHPEDLPEDALLFAELAAGKRDRYQIEKRYIRKDGRVLWGRLQVSLARNSKGEPEFAVSLVEDITARKETQAALEESEARYRSLVEMSPDAILVHAQERVLFANTAGFKLFGAASPEEIMEHHLLALVHPDFRELVKQRVKRGYAGERAELSEIKILRFDGQAIDVETAATPITFQGQPAVQVVVRDITERKQTERELRRLASFPESNPNPVLEVNEEGQIIYANPAARGVMEKLGIDGGMQAFLPPGLEQSFAKARQGGPRQYSYDLTLKDLVFAVDLSFPHDLPTARLYALDITERKRADDALVQKMAEFEAIFHSISDGVIFADPERRIVMVNPAAETLFGYASEEIQGHTTEFLYTSREDYEEQGRRRYHTQADHPLPVYEINYRHKDGSVFPAESKGSQVKDAQGKVIGFVSIHRDITERKQAEEALRESREDLNRAQAVAHTGSWRLNVQKNELTWSDESHRIFGIPRDTPLTYELFLSNVHPEDREYVDRKWMGALRGEPYAIEHRIVVGGQVKWVRERAELEFDPEGRLLGGFGTTQDISERKQAEEALQKNREWLAAILGSISDGFFVLDENLKVTYFNDAAETLLGRPRGDVLGKNLFEEAFPEARGSIFETYYRQALREKKPVFFEAYFARTPYENWYDVRAYPHEDGLSVFFQVTTERKQAEEALRRAHDELEERVVERTAALRLANEQLLWEMEERQEAEDRLRESEARFAAFMQHLPGLAVMRDVQGRYVFANEAWERMAKKTRNDWQGKTLEDLWPQEKAGRFQQLDQQVLLAGEPLESLETLELADGLHHFLAYRFPIKDKDGLSYLVGAIGIDITRRIQAEEEARRQMRLFEAFFDNTITPLVFLDSDFNFIRVNQAYARACHREVSDFAGRNHFDLYPSDARLIFEEVVRSKIPYEAVARPFEFLDHPEWGVTYWDWTLTPILDENGEVDFLVYSLKDVTEQVEAEEERRRLVDILESTPDFVGIADFSGNLQYLNRAGRSLVGVGQDEDVSQLRVLQLHPDRFGDLILKEGGPVARREGAWQAESALLHRDGREIPVSQVIQAHKDARSRVQFFSTIARDISDLKEAQESILRQTAVLNGINRIFREALTCETEEELGRTCLAVAEDLTNSRFGFIDELNEQGSFDALAFSDPGWEMCSISPVQDLTHLKNIKPVGLLIRPIQEGKTLIANNPASHPDAVGTPAGHPPLTAYLGTPLIFGDRTIGLIGLGNKAGGYTVTDRETIETLAPSIVEALMHQRTKRDLEKSESKLRHLADQLLTAQENERKRLAAELHDELGHALLTLKLALSSIAKELLPAQEDIKREIRDQLAYITEVIDEVRRLYQDLSPGDVEDLGLTRALRTLIEDFASHLDQITWKVNLPDLEGLFSQPVQTIVYRLVQEALTNIGKHANPEHVTVSARKEGSSVHFAIQDDGIGFDKTKVLDSHAGLGLAAMEERLNMVGGSFAVWSKKGEGTRLSFSIPTLPEDERE